MRITKSIGHSALLVVNILFGINMSVSKDLLNGVVSPVGLSTLRFLAGTVAFWMFALIKREHVSKKDLLILLVGASFGLLGNQVFFLQGLSRTSTIDASIIATTVPILTMILSALILKEPISWLKAIGVLVGASGAVFLVYSAQQGELKSGDMIGDLLCFGSALSFSLFLVITKPVMQRYSSLTVMKWMFLFATLLMLPFSINDISSVNYSGMELRNLLSFGFVIIFATVIPYLLIPVGQKTLRPTTQAMYNYVQPIVAVAIAIIAGTNTFTVTKAFAASLVFIGVYIVTRSKSRADVEAAKARMS